MITLPFVPLYDQLDKAFSSLQIDGMKSIDHEDKENNNDFSVDPLADPRLDKMDLFNFVDTKDRDVIMNASTSFNSFDSDDDYDHEPKASPASETSSVSGNGE